jgi:RNA polymerase sigma-70 factor (sigma-E family)
MRGQEEREFRDFVFQRLSGLRRTAYLMCGDVHGADDIVSAALANLVRRWRQVSRMEHPDAYLRRMLVSAFLDEKRRPWRHEQPTEVLPEPEPVDAGEVVDRVTLIALLRQLPPRRRAVLVLRFYCDLSVEATADALGVATGTVKAHTHHGLTELRGMLTAGEHAPDPSMLLTVPTEEP